MGHKQSSGGTPREDSREDKEIQFFGQVDQKTGRAEQRASSKSKENDAPRRKIKVLVLIKGGKKDASRREGKEAREGAEVFPKPTTPNRQPPTPRTVTHRPKDPLPPHQPLLPPERSIPTPSH